MLLKNFISEETLSRFKNESAQLISLVLADMKLDIDRSTWSGFDRGLDLLLKADRPRAGRLYMAMRKLPSVYDILNSPRVWAVVKQLMKTALPGIYPNGTGVRMDHPGETSYLSPWHQEYPANLTSPNAVTLWVPFANATEANGCLLIAPGSHKLGALPVNLNDPLNRERNANYAIDIPNIEKILSTQEVICAEVEAGDALIFHTYLLHSSQPNRSPQTRWTMQCRYFDFLNPVAIQHDWVGGMNEGIDLSKVHPELIAHPTTV